MREDVAKNTHLARDTNIGGLRVFGRSTIPNLVDEPSFRIRRASIGRLDGQETVAVDFECKSGTKYESTIRGTFVFDPKHAWLLRKADFEMQQSLEPHRAHFYLDNVIEERADGVPFVTQETTKVCLEDGSLIREETRVFEARPINTAEDIFTLSHFGFREPDFHSSSKTRLWSLLLGSVLLVLFVAVFVWRRKAFSMASS